MKKDKSLNDEQNLAVYSRGSSILVSAPAGSGKTKILVNRMMSLIEDDHVSVDSLLVLTFTKAAALEMKQRLVESLNKRIHIVDDSLKVHLEKQKILLNDAYITNFHSFCSDLLSQYGYTIHLDSKFEILENPTLIKENILNQCLEKWVQEKEFYDFYRTTRGYSANTTTHPTLTSNVKFMNFYPFNDIETISPRPLLFIAGEDAHSIEFSEDAYRLASEPKELYIVPNAGHVDLYDRTDVIPFAKLTEFFKDNL